MAELREVMHVFTGNGQAELHRGDPRECALCGNYQCQSCRYAKRPFDR